jgi:MoaA/NifB/PqqE/SkfB family radical SAM enzyme
MNLPHDKFCILPWVSLEASPIGTVRPCCLAEEEILDDDGNKFELISAEFSAVQNSKYMKDLRQQFLDQKQPRTCRKCWNEERSGRTSKRMHTLDRLKHVVSDSSWTADAKPLMFLDLKLGNICNLKCRICGSWSSSQFAAEELHFVNRAEKKTSIHYEMLKKGAWPRENPGFWREIDAVLDQIRYIEFTGGEPFMIQEHFDMLQGIVDRGIAHQVEIHYNTNGTQWPENAEEIWQHFKTVEIAFSIDDLDSRFEYQRTNATWSDVGQNLERFRELRSRHNNITLQVCATVNVFNVFYLENLANWIDTQQFDFIYWNMLHEAYYLSVGTMPDRAKTEAIGRLERSSVRDFHRREFDRIIDFIKNGNSLDGNILRMKVADLDRRRNTDLRADHPELAQAIDYAGPNG